MASVSSLYADHEFQNYISANRGMCYVGKQVETYTKEKLENLYQKIYTRNAKYPPCIRKCSETHGNDRGSWCQSCQQWMKCLKKYHRKKDSVQWGKTQSWTWVFSFENIAEVYLPAHWSKPSEIKFNDISTVCNIWKNCREFEKLKPFVVPNVQRVRNNYLAHNTTELRLTAEQKSEVFDALQDVIKDPDVTSTLNFKECLKELKDIETGDQLTLWLKNIDSRIIEQSADVSEIKERIKEQCYRENARSEKKKVIFNRISIWHILVAVIVACTAVFGLSYYTNWSEETINVIHEDCVSEAYEMPFRQDLPLLDYLRDHSELIGRDWLFDELERDIFDDYDSRSVIVFAEMGYGKSAIVSHLLCANKHERGHRIRNHIVAFHICKFDVEATRSPARFIRRLVGFLSTKFPEFGNIISFLPNTSVIYDKESCADEIEGCFDQGIINPLKELNRQWKKEYNVHTWLLVIDALDECFEKSLDKNPIKDIIISRKEKFPKWMRFLITSRNLTIDERKMKIHYLFPHDERNLQDIRSFISKRYKTKLQRVEQVLEKSEGNFLYLTHALEHISKTNRLELPTDLEEIYEVNFDRQFGGSKNFEVSKSMLEVISATLNPVDTTTIFNILNSSLALSRTEFDRECSKLAFFLRLDGNVTLIHKSIYEWLVSDSNVLYRISVENGHRYISKYLFSMLGNASADDFIDLTIHVANSHDIHLSDLYHSLTISSIPMSNKSILLHNLVSRTSSSKPLSMLIHHIPNVNRLDLTGISPLFLACKLGHLEQIQTLYNKKANISFVLIDEACASVNLYDVFDKILNIKESTFLGYNCLHVATKYRYFEIVNFILKVSPPLLKTRTLTGQTPLEIVCENGFGEIAELLLSMEKTPNYEQCLYNAAKNNHLNVIKIVAATKKYKCTCISDRRSNTAAEHIFDIPECGHYIHRLGITQSNVVDEWHIWHKESALHVAIRQGAVEAALFIMKHFPCLRYCMDGFGYTPALLSIRYNRFTLFQNLLPQITTDVCGGFNASLLWRADVHSHFETDECQSGANFAHLIARYHVDLKLLSDFGNTSWNVPDDYGNYPIHYAVESQNIPVIEYREVLGINVERERSANGSTGYHLAALYLNYNAMSALTKRFKKHLEEVHDGAKMGILHMLVLKPDSAYRLPNMRRLDMFKYFAYQNITHQEVSGKNILFYILSNGLGSILNYLLEFTPTSVRKMMLTKDSDGNTPFEYAVKFGEGDTYVHGDMITWDVLEKIENNGISSWSTFGYTLSLLIRFMTTADLRAVLVPNLFVVANKSALALKAVFVFHSNIDLTSVQMTAGNSITTASQIQLNTQFYYALYVLMSHRPDVISVCSKPFKQSPIHAYMLHQGRVERVDAFNRQENDMILDLISLNNLHVNCSDNRGLGVFHYALLGGNIPAASFLERIGSEIINDNVTLLDVILMTQFALDKPKLRTDELCNNIDQITCTDQFLSNLIKSNKYALKYSQLCYNHSVSLSVVHLLAINGMAKTLEYLGNTLGRSLFNCVNKGGLTPRYFAEMFDRGSTVDLLRKYTHWQTPSVSHEEVFILNIANKYPQLHKSNMLMLLSQSAGMSTRFNERRIKQTFRWLKFSPQNSSLYKGGGLFYPFLYVRQLTETLLKIYNEHTKVRSKFDNGNQTCKLIKPYMNRMFVLLRSLNMWLNIDHAILHMKTNLASFKCFFKNMLVNIQMLGKPCVKYDLQDEKNILRVWHIMRSVERLVLVSQDKLRGILADLVIGILKRNTVPPREAGDFMRNRMKSLGYNENLFGFFPHIRNIGGNFLKKEYSYMNIIISTLTYRQYSIGAYTVYPNSRQPHEVMANESMRKKWIWEFIRGGSTSRKDNFCSMIQSFTCTRTCTTH